MANARQNVEHMKSIAVRDISPDQTSRVFGGGEKITQSP